MKYFYLNLKIYFKRLRQFHRLLWNGQSETFEQLERAYQFIDGGTLVFSADGTIHGVNFAVGSTSPNQDAVPAEYIDRVHELPAPIASPAPHAAQNHISPTKKIVLGHFAHNEAANEDEKPSDA